VKFEIPIAWRDCRLPLRCQWVCPTSHFLNTHLNIILPSTPGSPKLSLSLRFPHQNPVYASSLPRTCDMFRISTWISYLFFLSNLLFMCLSHPTLYTTDRVESAQSNSLRISNRLFSQKGFPVWATWGHVFGQPCISVRYRDQ